MPVFPKGSLLANDNYLIDSEAFRQFATDILLRVGIEKQQAVDAAEVLTWTSLRGVDTHGARNLKRYYVDWINQGVLNPHAQFRVEHETTLAARTDGDGGIGLSAACWAMRLAMEKARQSGVGMVSMRRSHHLGAAGYYAHMALAHDMIGLCMTGYMFAAGNDSGVIPTFGTRPMLSTNPLAVAFPCKDQPPFVLDMATSIVPVNRLELMQETGRPIPLGWGLDAQGRPTNDPEAMKHFLPLGGDREHGGHKGFGLAMMVEVLSAVLSACWCENPEREKILGDDKELSKDGYAQEGVGHFFMAIRIDQFRKVEGFKQDMDAMVRAIGACPPELGQDRVYYAGELEHITQRQRLDTGIPLPSHIAADLRELSETYDVPLKMSHDAI